MFFDPLYFLFIAPAVILGMWAQHRIRSTYEQASGQSAPMSGASAARRILDWAGLRDVQIEEIPGELSDHYDSQAKVLRLSSPVFQGRTLAAVGIAAHESGHALQDARNYAPLAVRNAAVPVANFGGGFSWILLLLGVILHFQPLLLGGIALFGCVVFFQLINLPVEFNASSRAKDELVALGIVPPEQMVYVNKVLNAAALTYVAATLQALLTLLYYVVRFTGDRR